jgi:hypothetical protein
MLCLNAAGLHIDFDLGDQRYVTIVALIGNATDSPSAGDFAAMQVGFWRRPSPHFAAWALGELRGPMRDETEAWLNRVSLGVPTPHATMLTKALDLSARRRRPVSLPLSPEDK